ncbi:MAG: DUF151 domain-containing protein [Candidatus Hatepunaea meridiana]|nr:DUF151 domain-containing protein [Candidatus Hatepunaea meridiana]
MVNVLVEVSSISIFPPLQGGYVVILKEKTGERLLPIYIGAPEAHNISLVSQEIKYVRPLTYDMFSNILQQANIKIEYISINELRDSTFYADIVFMAENRKCKIDARPSDAIALAIKTKSPIFVNSKVLNEAGGTPGKIDFSSNNKGERIRVLNKQLEEAVEIEAYEEAAKIRDQIRSLEDQKQSI